MTEPLHASQGGSAANPPGLAPAAHLTERESRPNPNPIHRTVTSNTLLRTHASAAVPSLATASQSTDSPSSSTQATPKPRPMSLSAATRTTSAPDTPSAQIHPTPSSSETLSRRPSQLQSTRPAPPSPAPSRRASGIGIPTLASTRDRTGSVSSNAQSNASGSASASGTGSASQSQLGHGAASSSSGVAARRVSQSSGLSSSGPGTRTSSRPRPRSSLGTAVYTEAASDLDPPVSAPAVSPDISASTAPSQLASQSVPEEASAEASSSRSAIIQEGEGKGSTTDQAESTVPAPEPKSTRHAIPNQMYIRDYGFPATDKRYLGVVEPTQQTSASASRLSGILSRSAGGAAEDDASGHGGGGASSGSGSGGWGGFSFSWRGLMRKARTSSQSRGVSDADTDADEYTEAIDVDHTDDYAFESGSEADDESGYRFGRHGAGGHEDEDDEDEDESRDYAWDAPEPVGMYRISYAFEAQGEHEMDVRENELLDIKGRGGGDGWLIAIRVQLRDGPLGRVYDEDELEEVVRRSQAQTKSRAGSRAKLALAPHDANDASPTGASQGQGVCVPDDRLQLEEVEEGLVPESYLDPRRHEGLTALVEALRIKQGWGGGRQLSNLALRLSGMGVGAGAGGNGGDTSAQGAQTHAQAQGKTVAPDGISEEPEEVSDLEAEMERADRERKG